MRAIQRIAMLFGMVAFAAAAMVGCNTVKGAGKDIERGGEKLQGAAEGAKSK